MATDGTEAWARLAEGVGLEGFLDLSPTKGLEGKVTPEAARAAYGGPVSTIHDSDGVVRRYEKGGRVIEIVESLETPSDGGAPVTRYSLRVPVSDPPFSARLPTAIPKLWASNSELREVVLISGVRSEPVVTLVVKKGRVSFVRFGWAPEGSPPVGNPKAK